MTRKEIAEYRQRLHKILNIEDENQRLGELKQLAKEVGAGYEHTEIATATTTTTTTGNETRHDTTTYSNPISESELVLNINNALQTEIMIDMCKTATKNYRIAFVAVIAAAFSALAAWSAIVAVNRYAISATEGGMYILDTRTGQTWLRAASTEYNLGTTNKPIFKLVEYEEPPPLHSISSEEMEKYEAAKTPHSISNEEMLATKEDPNN